MNREIDTSKAQALQQGGKHYLKAWEGLPRCGQCSRPMRPFRSIIKDWPATVSRATGQACSVCYNRGFRAGGQRPQFSASSKLRRNVLPDISGTTRAQRAAGWSEEEHAAAWQVCSFVRDPSVADGVMQMLGLFEDPSLRPVAFMSSDLIVALGRSGYVS